MKLTDETRMVGYPLTYRSYDGRLLQVMVCYGYEHEGQTAEQLLSEAMRLHSEQSPRIMTFAEFDALDRELTLSRGVYEVDELTFDEMLNVLPPLKWCDRTSEQGVKVNEFCMSEFDHGPFTQQYARAHIGGRTRYYGATVDYFDESTWIHNRL